MYFKYHNKNIFVIDDLKQWGIYNMYIHDNKFYEDEFLNYTLSLNLAGIYLDIGANIGNHSLFWGLFSKADKIISFEPLPRFVHVLIKNLIANKVLHKVDIYPFGLSDIQGYQNIKFFDTITPTLVKRLDDICLKLDSHISLLKVDIEGMEPQCLAGAINIIKKNKPIIFAEAHSNSVLDKIMSIIEPIGYQLSGKIFNASPTYEIIANNTE